MKKLTTKQKQAIYEHLLTLDCPDLLAALIAERSTRYSRHIDTTIYDVIADNFEWDQTPEESDGSEFWYEIYVELAELENTAPTGQEHEDALQKALEESYEPVKIEIKHNSTVTNYKVGDMIISDKGVLVCQAVTNPSPRTSFFDKVVLFFGRLFYKV
jgi:hypothetical protein